MAVLGILNTYNKTGVVTVTIYVVEDPSLADPLVSSNIVESLEFTLTVIEDE